jgi:FkbM family methyltransferase
MTTNEELMRAAPATHYIKSWSGIVDPKDASAVTHNSVWAQLGQSEPHEPHFRLFECMTGTPLFMDVGANCGQSIISFKSVVARARIQSFEPTPFSFDIAARVAKVFGDVAVSGFGLSDRNVRLPIFTPVIDGLLVTPLTSLHPSAFEPGGTMHKLLTDDIAKGAEVSLFAQEIELRRGDDLGFAPDVVKIDVEGAELQVLRGLKQTIEAHGPLIMTEKSDAIGIARYLAGFGYDPYRYDSQRPEDRAVLKYLAIIDGMNPDLLPLNIFYANRDKTAFYGTEYDLKVEMPSGH